MDIAPHLAVFAHIERVRRGGVNPALSDPGSTTPERASDAWLMTAVAGSLLRRSSGHASHGRAMRAAHSLSPVKATHNVIQLRGIGSGASWHCARGPGPEARIRATTAKACSLRCAGYPKFPGCMRVKRSLRWPLTGRMPRPCCLRGARRTVRSAPPLHCKEHGRACSLSMPGSLWCKHDGGSCQGCQRIWGPSLC